MSREQLHWTLLVMMTGMLVGAVLCFAGLRLTAPNESHYIRDTARMLQESPSAYRHYMAATEDGWYTLSDYHAVRAAWVAERLQQMRKPVNQWSD